ncbi:MAG TPA: hypothetical protein VFX17_04370 [Patescibacteria group bacterium]|nr:hypothetical protein [Patescibacteria group bacterium]
MKRQLVGFGLIFFALSFVPHPAFAASCGTDTNTGTTTTTNSTGQALTSCVSQVYVWSISVAAVLAVLMIIVGGYITLTSAGNADRATRGRSYIFSSVIGLILLLGAYILLKTINPDLVDFSSSCVNHIDSCAKPADNTTVPPPHN